MTRQLTAAAGLMLLLASPALVRYADVPVSQGTETVAQLNPPVYRPAIQYQNTCPTCPNYAPSFGGCPGGNCPQR